ncbi:hypothetical protein BD324DRAFT_633591 [Kockovaella imperatae]|uniref:ABC transporter domain-containing protein n=1 Tax=Kockovaella imperatae TaxID=4999 RepID=A0A1Y1UBU3_9TREE|nr:hypothetical protein BD324DRAFT_633591 [Kockovaella imperatae]ORX35007.1 hypothetical protein BD324DRAFT_633591 [Kockovaella imperatae]
MGTFIAQFSALCRKNWIILWRHKWINLIRCLILPVAYAIFFAKAQDFFTTRAVLGPGHISNLQPIPSSFLNHKFVWVPPSDSATNETVSTFIDQLMNKVLGGHTGDIVKLDNASNLARECPENFNLLSECFGALVFDNVDPDSRTLNYTLRGDFGLVMTNVDQTSKDDVQVRYLPLQWAIDSNFIEMTTGTKPPSPLTWEYTNRSAGEQSERNRLSYLRGIRSLIVLAFFLVFLGVVYQLPGGMAEERASSLTSHLDAMGCKKSARVISWHLSISSVYVVAWLAVGAIFQHFIFKRTNTGLFIILYLLTGLSLASWTFIVAVPFANAPTLAAITATFVAIILAIGALLTPSSAGIQLIFTLIFPPMFYTFFTKNLASFESHSIVPNILRRSPQGDAPVLGLLIIAIIDIVLYPLLATWLETKVYGVPAPDYVSWWRRRRSDHQTDSTALPEDVAIAVVNLRKAYSTKRFGVFGRGKPFVAIEDLSFNVPKGEIFTLLGRNGAAKSTTLSAIARLTTTSGGNIRYGPDLHLGIASQKDVLWDELTCKQHVQLWRAIKSSAQHRQDESNLDLLARCDLAPKVSFLAKNLSGGQKRKLQLACALAGGSNLLLLDEISSGLDPLSRRAIWKLITANRGRTTIILTTHFLDEADYLADTVAILHAPGRLLAIDNPVTLKHRFGKGYTISFSGPSSENRTVAERICRHLSGSRLQETKGGLSVSARTTDLQMIQDAFKQARQDSHTTGEARFQLNGASLEEVFLDLNRNSGDGSSETSEEDLDITAVLAPSHDKMDTIEGEKGIALAGQDVDGQHPMMLTLGHKPSYILAIPMDAWTIFRKRLVIFRRAWLLPIVAIIIAITATCIPLFFIKNRNQTCALVLDEATPQTLTYPRSYFPIIETPPMLSPASTFGPFDQFFFSVRQPQLLPDNQTFVDELKANITNNTFGGLSLSSDPKTEQSLFAWEGSPLENKGPSLLNFLNNVLLDSISPPSGVLQAFRINLNFQYFASPDFSSTAQAMKWIGFAGLGLAVWPAFAVIYPTVERASNVRSNQYSNGAAPVSLWLGHLLFELPGILFVSSVITIVYFVASSQFSGPGDLWICLVLYGIASTLYAYLFALFLDSALAAWALVAGTNVILFLLYLAAYLLILTYDRSSAAVDHITISHFTIGLVNPVPNVIRAVLVSVNLFGLLCDGLGHRKSAPYSNILQFGGPIVYLVAQALFAFGVLVYVDSGSPIPAFLRRRRLKHASTASEEETSTDVIDEKARIDSGPTDDLIVQSLSKRYSGSKALAVNDVTFGVAAGESFALIGPNGAGKSTTLACIRGVEVPTAGDVRVAGSSIKKRRNVARSYLGVCPQVNAIDVNLTVRQHLWVYGRLKGVPSSLLSKDIDVLLAHAGLSAKANELATSLSGGNQRKLSLAIALIGDRPVVLIDEFSSGVDPFSKREAWQTLASLTKDRAVVMTTHSMEEVDALASRVGIIASKMLAVGTPASLKSRFATYEIHLTSSDHLQDLVSRLQSEGFENTHQSRDTATRVSVPGVTDKDLGGLLDALVVAKQDLGLEEMTIHEASTETAFLEIVRKHNVQEEEGKVASKKSRLRCWP